MVLICLLYRKSSTSYNGITDVDAEGPTEFDNKVYSTLSKHREEDRYNSILYDVVY